MKREKGFTLIELLIVVAIIAILAAIAVPNFLEARTRAIVARVDNDLRTLALGMESYRIDNGTYVASYGHSPLGGGSSGGDHRLLSTPIAYLSEGRLMDPYRKFQGATTYRIYAMQYVDGEPTFGYPRDAWMTWSYGPDEITQTGSFRSLETILANEAREVPDLGTGTQNAYPFLPNNPGGYGGTTALGIRYDPSNGTVSVGDIYRMDGLAKTAPNQYPG